ncbi:MAG: dihydropteroate synthase [Chloroflexota bacterium]
MIQLPPVLNRPPSAIQWGTRTYVMGILNVTPDSFSGDGLSSSESHQETIDNAIAQAVAFVEQGADIIDIGGESTRPNSEVVDGETERRRIVEVIREVRNALPKTVISVDTYRSKTADAALNAGADWINDIWGFKHDTDLPRVSAEANCPVVLMHNGRNRPRLNKDDGAGGYYGYFEYVDLIGEVKAELIESVDIAKKAGVKPENIVVDVGIGFGKTAPQNIELLKNLSALCQLEFPMLLGTSRKGFIGQYLGGLPADQRVEGTMATSILGIQSGVDILRVHDVQETVRAARIADLIVR